MASRLSQAPLEAVVQPDSVKSRVSQTAVEAVILLGDVARSRVTQLAVEVLVESPPAIAEISQTQVALEVVQLSPPSSAVDQTQTALEHVYDRPNEIWASQVCLEVLFPAVAPPTPTSRRNHSFIGVWMGTGHEDNASFSF